ncbi:hypothetical protein EJ06DRAFT_490326 [Trichodelitschia bisporula]|uniref:Tho complex subunit 7 n=1 Tax=Trichodelitschia bisporula TaxID=703511 RepID=A0A6G1I235_9PEZI|nr:hypothetical protein EJ06DRAFT_490326 [Trichodelitschia bisporula]
MTTYDYRLLDQQDEDKLHTNRLMGIEQRPFQRVAKRLLAPDSPVLKTPTQTSQATRQESLATLEQFREEMLLDFAALESTMVRIQLLRTSNEQERKRYAEEKLRITGAADAIRANTTELRTQLDGARTTMQLRKTYDELAERITSNRMLRPREDQAAQLEKLNTEIAELEQESQEYARTWAERREAFGRIVEDGRRMLELIRDEKEEAERKEGMERRDDDESARPSLVGTPRDGDAATPLPDVPMLAPGRPLPLVVSARASPAPEKLDTPDVEMGEYTGAESQGSVLEEGEEEEGEQMDE